MGGSARLPPPVLFAERSAAEECDLDFGGIPRTTDRRLHFYHDFARKRLPSRTALAGYWRGIDSVHHRHLSVPFSFPFHHRSVISSTHGFLVEDAKPVLPSLRLFFAKVGESESYVFASRAEQSKSHHSPGRMSSPPVRLAT